MRIPVLILRGVFVGILILAALAMVAPAQAAPKASIVMDMRNGEVLYSEKPDQRLHPASLTKMMTLYLTFEAVREGRLRLNQKVRVSRNAARQPASKLYLKAGQHVTVQSLIRATALKSANDAAMVLAETLGGSQAGFARMMTRKAKYLGMKNSAFKNPHGLTAGGHYSSARDMAILARHLFFDFPEYYNIFKRQSDYAAGKRVWNTNRLLKSYPGADGIKTGYTRAAGYNLVASAERGGKRVIAVQFGASSSADRSRRVANLLDIGFSRAPKSVRKSRPKAASTVVANMAPGWSPVPRGKRGQGDSRIAAIGEFLVPEAAAAVPDPKDLYSAPAIAELPIPRNRGEDEADGDGLVHSPIPPRKPQGKMGKLAQSSTNWSAEVGPYSTEERALADLARMSNQASVARVATGFRISQSVGRVGKSIYKLQLHGLSQGKASQICGDLLQSSIICRVVPTRN